MAEIETQQSIIHLKNSSSDSLRKRWYVIVERAGVIQSVLWTMAPSEPRTLFAHSRHSRTYFDELNMVLFYVYYCLGDLGKLIKSNVSQSESPGYL